MVLGCAVDQGPPNYGQRARSGIWKKPSLSWVSQIIQWHSLFSSQLIDRDSLGISAYAHASQKSVQKDAAGHRHEYLECPCQLIGWKIERLCDRMIHVTWDGEGFPCT